MKTEERARKAIKAADSIVNYMVLMVVLALVAFAGYALWDSKQLYHAADKSQYAIYKPTVENEGKSFRELQAINPEVIAWLSVFGTNIDYPVTQGEDNMKYVNTNAEGQYSLSGAIFLDSGNSKDFSDFNSILYGHHMEKKAMFGELDSFADKNVFDSHQYGSLYFDGKDHGIEFFAFIRTDAYDSEVFRPNVKSEEDRMVYLATLFLRAMHQRDSGIKSTDRIILLSTCSSNATNGRDLLVGRLTDEVFEDPFRIIMIDEDDRTAGARDGVVKGINPWPLLLALALILRVIVLIRRARADKKMYKGMNQGITIRGTRNTGIAELLEGAN